MIASFRCTRWTRLESDRDRTGWRHVLPSSGTFFAAAVSPFLLSSRVSSDRRGVHMIAERIAWRRGLQEIATEDNNLAIIWTERRLILSLRTPLYNSIPVCFLVQLIAVNERQKTVSLAQGSILLLLISQFCCVWNIKYLARRIYFPF